MHSLHILSNLPNRSFRSPTSWVADLLLDIRVKPTMSANRIETFSIAFMLKGRKIVRMSPWLEDRGLEIFLIMEPEVISK